MSMKTKVHVPRYSGEGDDRERFADAIVQWLAVAGATNYDESVTQYEHALQSAALAQARGAGKALVIAALLHDVGHLLADEHDGHGNFLGVDLQHELIGAKWLARAFVPEVTEPVRWHVAAKRYLCAVDPAYHAALSESSKRSLVVQGGVMLPAEASAFIALPAARDAVELRRIDDLAKKQGVEVSPGAAYRPDLVAMMRS